MPGPVVLIKWGVIAAAGDITMAMIVNNPSSQTRAAIVDLIQDVAAQIIASDPTIIQAADEAVAGALTSKLSLSKSVHKEGADWIWDPNGGAASTHYVLFDHAGAAVIRPTPFPTPAATPALNW